MEDSPSSGKKPKRAYTFHTIDAIAYPVECDRPLTREQVFSLMGISSTRTQYAYLRDLGIPYHRHFDWQLIREILGAWLWVWAAPGENSRRQWANLQAKKRGEKKLGEIALEIKYNLSLETKLKELKEKAKCQTN